MPAIGSHDTSVTEREWDGPAAVASAPNERGVLRYMHAWYSGEDPDEKTSYKLPHHGPEEGSPAVLPAVRNALARLSQTDMPSGDRDGVERHLNAHLADQEGGEE